MPEPNAWAQFGLGGLVICALFYGLFYLLIRRDDRNHEQLKELVKSNNEIAKSVALLATQQEGGYKFMIEQLLSAEKSA